MLPKKNMLICIDEVDNMCHPSWQRDIIGDIIHQINEEYQGYNIQLVISTNSPLALNNIPRENIIYMKNDNGVVKNIHGSDIQTFGRNIYELLNDSFYLNGNTIGSYAREYINNLIKRIKESSVDDIEENRDDYEERINYIGDDLIKAKLHQMLIAKVSGSDRKKKLSQLESYRKKIDYEIARLRDKE